VTVTWVCNDSAYFPLLKGHTHTHRRRKKGSGVAWNSSHTEKKEQKRNKTKKFRSVWNLFFSNCYYEGAISMEGLVWLSTVQFLVYTFGQGSNEWFSTNGLNKKKKKKLCWEEREKRCLNDEGGPPISFFLLCCHVILFFQQFFSFFSLPQNKWITCVYKYKRG
jgi:hypothetical protein